MDHRPALLWFTRDLRLGDQPAVAAAARCGRPVVAVYVLDDQAGGDWAIGAASKWWLHHSLAALAAALEHRGGTLILRRGETAATILALAAEIDAAEVHVGQPIEPAARAALAAVAAGLEPRQVALHRHWTTLLFNPDSLRTKTGGVYGVFTPFSKACLAEGVPEDAEPTPAHITQAPRPASDRLEDWGLLPAHPDWAGGLRQTWQPGEAEAERVLTAFVTNAVTHYADTRNLPGVEGVSRLSPPLHFGEISPRAAWHAAARHSGKGVQSFINELLWREFSAHLLWHHPTMPDIPLQDRFTSMAWRHDPAGLRAWQRGRTGIPIVDAGMRQLWHTGWQHNRVRLITASFLVKHLLIDWREGAKWFFDTLVDADLASNSQNWQWVAGCGADAAPFFRIFNPWLQGQKFDPDGIYVKRWVPELAGLETRYIHAPWDAPPASMPPGLQAYPPPIVDLAAGRQRALAAFAAVSDKAMR